MSSFALRLIAIICMAIDHTADCLVPRGDLWTVMRIIGRLAFPIYCFLIAEGIAHTRSAGKYIARVGAFALFSEVPFDLCFHEKFLESNSQNVLFTLTLGLCAASFAKFVDENKPKIKARLRSDKEFPCALVSILITVIVCVPLVWLGGALHTDYGSFGVVMVLCAYAFRREPPLMKRPLSPAALAGLNLSVHWGDYLQPYASLSGLILAAYNGKPGTKKYQRLFYWFYPVHLLFLYLIQVISTK